MKCVFCPNTIDETKAVDPRNEGEQRQHSATLEQWRQVEVKVGNRAVLVEHACPSHANVTDVAIALKSSSAPAATPAPTAPATVDPSVRVRGG